MLGTGNKIHYRICQCTAASAEEAVDENDENLYRDVGKIYSSVNSKVTKSGFFTNRFEWKAHYQHIIIIVG